MSRPRIRTLKPEFFADERVNALSVPCRYLTLGLITRADDRGRQRRQDSAIAAHVFPEADVGIKQVSRMLESIIEVGIALGYVVGSHAYLWLPNFWKHQRVNRPSESDVPPHPDDALGHLNIGDALREFRASSPQAHHQFTESAVSPHHSRAVPFPSLPDVVVPLGMSRERVDAAKTILASQWPDATDEMVENPAGMYPGVDMEQAARLAVTWASDPGWTMRSCSATLRSAMRKLDSEKPAESSSARRAAALRSVMAEPA